MSVRPAIGAWLVFGRLIRVAILAVLLAGVFSSSTVMLPSLYAQTFGATLTVLRGSAAVLQANGTPHSPAANGQTLGVGDQVATLTGGSALVTFFDGSEVELGAETTVIIREMDQRGGTTTITLESVVGTTLNRVVTLTGEQSSYRIETGGTVAVVRGTVFAHHRDASGDVTVAVGEGTVDFPSPGQPLRPGEKRTATSRGDVVDTHVDPAVPLITTVLEPVSRSNPSGTQNPGLATGSFVAPQQQSLQQQTANEPQDDPPPLPVPGHTVLVSPAAAGSTRLDVASTTGFAVGDAIKVGSGQDAEFHVVTGFGSILVEPPLGRSFEAGTSVDVIPNGSFPLPTRGTGEQPTPTLTPTKTPATAATFTPTATPESPAPTATETKTVTATPSESPTVSPTASPTMSVTATAAGTPTITPTATSTVTATATETNTATATAINTATATPTVTLTATPTVTLTATSTVTLTATSTVTPTATSTVTPTATSTVTPTATPTPPFPCLGPLTRQLATRGSGTTGTTRSVTASGIRLTAFVQLTDATPDTAFDFYIDVGGGSAGDHQLIGTFSTDGQGNATLTGSIVVPTVAANIDNELVLQGDVQSRHQYIRELFTPCPE